jgi:hypothetical protein
VFDNKAPKKMFGTTREDITRILEKITQEISYVYSLTCYSYNDQIKIYVMVWTQHIGGKKIMHSSAWET